MTREEVVAQINALAQSLEDDLEFCQTRDQHLRLAQRIADTRALALAVQAPAAPAA